YVYNIGEDGCERQSACEGLGYRIVASACVANLATNCTGSQGFTMGRCIAPTSASHCANRAGATYVYNIGEDGCERQSACEGQGRKVSSHACVASEAHDCVGMQGFENGRCIAPSTATHCVARGLVLNVEGNGCILSTVCEGAGHQLGKEGHVGRCVLASLPQVNCHADDEESVPSKVCADIFKGRCILVNQVLARDRKSCDKGDECKAQGYKVLDNACVAKAAGDCTGTQGFADGKCIMARQASHCVPRGLVLNKMSDGCEANTACEGQGYKVSDNACVAKAAGDCTGTQGFADGKCIMARQVSHCVPRGFVLNKMGDGCEANTACEGQGYKVVDNVCVAKAVGDCTGTQGFTNGRCIIARQVSHCVPRGLVLNKMGDGCEANTACEGQGYKVVDNACVASQPRDCRHHQGFDDGKCITPSKVAHCKAYGDGTGAKFVLSIEGNKCQTPRECQSKGYRPQGYTCVRATLSYCVSYRNLGFDVDKGTCIVPQKTADCQHEPGFVVTRLGSGCQTESDCLDEGYKITNGICVVKTGQDCATMEGLRRGKCVAPRVAQDCVNKGNGFILNRQGSGCQTNETCVGDGYKAHEGACVDNVAADCSGHDGFTAGRCIAPTQASHCTPRQRVLNKVGDGCIKQSACEKAGYKVDAHVCVAQNASDCQSSHGFDKGRCISKPSAEHCQNVGRFHHNSMCVVLCPGETLATQEHGVCIKASKSTYASRPAEIAVRCTASGKLLNPDETGCWTHARCYHGGYVTKRVAVDTSQGRQNVNSCLSPPSTTRCTGDRGFNAPTLKCKTNTTNFVDCVVVDGKVLQSDGTGCQTQESCKLAGYVLKTRVTNGRHIPIQCIVPSILACSVKGRLLREGRCVLKTAQACKNEGGVLRLDKMGCQTTAACRLAGHKIAEDSCVKNTKQECAGLGASFKQGACVITAATTCQMLGGVLQRDGTGCMTEGQCTDEGYSLKGSDGALQCSPFALAEDCYTGTTWVQGRCLPNVSSVCYGRNLQILQSDGVGCQSAEMCTQEGGVVVAHEGRCVASGQQSDVTLSASAPSYGGATLWGVSATPAGVAPPESPVLRADGYVGRAESCGYDGMRLILSKRQGDLCSDAHIPVIDGDGHIHAEGLARLGKIHLSRAFGDALKNELMGLTLFDALDRPFAANDPHNPYGASMRLSHLSARSTERVDLHERLHMMTYGTGRHALDRQHVWEHKGHKASFAYALPGDRYGIETILQDQQIRFATTLSPSFNGTKGKVQFHSMYGVSMGHAIGLGFDDGTAQTAYAMLTDDTSFQAPYLRLASGGMAGGMHYVLDNGQRLGFVIGHGTALRDDGSFVEGDSPSETAVAGMVEYALSPQWMMHAGFLREHNAVLSSSGDGMFALDKGSMTTFVGMQAQHALSDAWYGLASAYVGRTEYAADGEGLVQGIDVVTSSFDMGLLRRRLFSEHDHIFLRIGQPMRVEKGTLNVRYVNQPYGGGEQRFNMTPQGRRMDIGLTYGVFWTETMRVMMGVDYIVDEGHKDGGRDELFGMVSVQGIF
ncbi:MAG: hypothetical protein GDA54_02670, partial [Alphaproteobacteria bacterium GM7ARS4]|nr:hypothetical protein [Alphaproteobacteria bacterium GM7ARS4]